MIGILLTSPIWDMPTWGLWRQQHGNSSGIVAAAMVAAFVAPVGAAAVVAAARAPKWQRQWQQKQWWQWVAAVVAARSSNGSSHHSPCTLCALRATPLRSRTTLGMPCPSQYPDPVMRIAQGLTSSYHRINVITVPSTHPILSCRLLLSSSHHTTSSMSSQHILSP